MLPVGDTSEQQTQPADPDAQHAELIVQLLTAPKADRDFLERIHGLDRDEGDEGSDAA